MNHTVPSSALLSELLACCRTLTDHLQVYTFTPDAVTYDEDAVIAIERAERLLHEARHLLGPQKAAPARS